MDIYSNAVYANLSANHDAAGHALFAERAGYSSYVSTHFGGDAEAENIEAARHQHWLFANEIRYSSCPLIEGEKKNFQPAVPEVKSTWCAWSNWEEAVLRSSYPIGGLPMCLEYLDRSPDAIRVRASKLGLKTPRHFTAQEDQVIRDKYPFGGVAAVRLVLTNRSASAVYCRANRLGVYRENAIRGRIPAAFLADINGD